MARGKNLGDMVFDIFQQAEQESEVKSQKKWLVAEISDLLSLFVRDRTSLKAKSLGMITTSYGRSR